MKKNNKGKNDFLGGLFDFNSDGKTSLSEKYIAFRVFEECTKEDRKTNDFFTDPPPVSNALEKGDWRSKCNSGFEFGVFPEDYKTEEEYNEALEYAKYAWRDTCDDGSEFGIDPDDYETEEEYEEALEEAMDI